MNLHSDFGPDILESHSNSESGVFMSRVNQQLIADRANISRATVSRCFTNHPGINPETRAAVFRLASELGYRHMEMRTGSKQKKTGRETIGVLVCTKVEEYLRPDYQSPGVEIYSGICEYAQLHKLHLDLRYVDPEDEALSGPSYSEIEPLRKRDWSGALLIYPFPRGVVDGLHKLMPVLSLVEQYGSGPLDCVDVDHFKGISLIINRLCALGHRRIGFYTKEYDVEPGWSFRRYSAFVEKMCRLKIRVPEQDLVNIFPNIFPTLEASYDHVANRVRDGVTAWVCAADHQAYDLMHGLRQRGLRIPEDVSVTGFDGIKVPASEPELTTVIIPYREIGFTGAKRLHDLMRKRFVSSQHILVGSRMREGETISRPKSAPRQTALARAARRTVEK